MRASRWLGAIAVGRRPSQHGVPDRGDKGGARQGRRAWSAWAADRLRGEEGSAPIEFVFASVVLLIPLVYLVVALAQLQAGAYAAHASAVDAARVAAAHPSDAEARAAELAELHFADFGLADVSYTLDRECSGPCDEAGTLVTAHVEAAIPIPGIPALFGGPAGRIAIHAAHTDVVAEEADTGAPSPAAPTAAAERSTSTRRSGTPFTTSSPPPSPPPSRMPRSPGP